MGMARVERHLALAAPGVQELIRSASTRPCLRPGDGFPSTIFAINLTGAFLLGLLLDGLAGNDPDIDARGGVRLVLGTGFLGGSTASSTASFETVRLLQQGKRLAGTLNGVGVSSGQMNL